MRVLGDRERPLGWALFSEASQITLRIVSTESKIDDATTWPDRLARAIALRATLDIDATAYRLVHGEADRLPALIVDRYDDVLVMQTLCQGMDRRLPQLVEALVALVKPRGILARNDPRVRRLEGLDERVDVVYGDVPDSIDVREGAITTAVDVRLGQKTGLFLDQRENHRVAMSYARGRALDAFAYNGGFALQMAARAASVLALDSSAPAVAATRVNAARNRISNLHAREVNVFDELRELDIAGDRFDTIVLDPPAFAKNKASVEKAISGYKEINLRAMKLLEPGGHLMTCSCSYNIDESLFMEILHHAAVDARVTLALVEKRLQARDHPILVGVPETYYLKCVVLRRVV